MTMIDYVASGRRLTPAMAKWYADYCTRLISAMHPVMGRGQGLVFQSPSVLERRLRQGIELHQERGDVKPYWLISNATIGGICDALLQTHDVVARFCHTEAHLEDYRANSTLYEILDQAGITYMPEPYQLMFRKSFWDWHYDTTFQFYGLFTKCQQWSLSMIVALHCLAMFQGHSPRECIELLPSFPYALLAYGETFFTFLPSVERRRFHALTGEDWPEGLSPSMLPTINWDTLTPEVAMKPPTLEPSPDQLQIALCHVSEQGTAVQKCIDQVVDRISAFEQECRVEGRPPTPIPSQERSINSVVVHSPVARNQQPTSQYERHLETVARLAQVHQQCWRTDSEIQGENTGSSSVVRLPVRTVPLAPFLGRLLMLPRQVRILSPPPSAPQALPAPRFSTLEEGEVLEPPEASNGTSLGLN